MELREIMRLAGAEDDAESFQVALEGKARPGYRPAVRPPLQEKRGGQGMMWSPASDRLYSRVCVAVDVLGELNGVVCGLWKCLDRMRYGDDPENGFGEAAGKILDGPLTDVEKMVKGLGYSLDRCFDTRGEREVPGMRVGGLQMVGYGFSSVDLLCLHLKGEAAETTTIMNLVGPQIDKAGARDLFEVDFDLWKKAWPLFQKSFQGRLDVLCEALDKLSDKMLASKVGGISDDVELAHRGRVLGEEHLNAGEPQTDWGFGLSEGGGDFEKLNVPGFGTLALIPKGENGYEVRSLGAGKPGPHAYGVIKNGKIVKVTKGYEKQMAAVLKTAVKEALEAEGVAEVLDTIGEAAADMVGQEHAGESQKRRRAMREDADDLGSAEEMEDALRKGVHAVFGATADKGITVSPFNTKTAQKIFAGPGGVGQTVGDITIQFKVPQGFLTRRIQVEALGGGSLRLSLLKKTGSASSAKWSYVTAETISPQPAAVQKTVETLLRSMLKKKTEATSVAEAAQHPVEVQLTIPAHKSSMADEDPKEWHKAEEKVASSMELELERKALQTQAAGTVHVRVTKSKFEGTGSKYALRLFLELVGPDVDRQNDDLVEQLIDALDRRAEDAFDNMMYTEGTLAELMFDGTTWKNSKLDVL